MLVFALPVVVLMWVGILDESSGGDRAPRGVITAPYYPGGPWAIVTDLAVAVVVGAVAAVLAQRILARYTGFHLTRLSAAGIVVLTGWWPLFGVHPIRLSGPVAFVVAVAVARYAATEDHVEMSWPVVPLLTLAGIAASAIVLYVAFHPVRLAGGGGEISFGPEPTTTSHMIVELRNVGFASIEIQGLSVPAYVGIPGGPHPAATATPLTSRRLGGPQRLLVTLKRPGCPPNVVSLRYRVFGFGMSEPVVLRQRCQS